MPFISVITTAGGPYHTRCRFSSARRSPLFLVPSSVAPRLPCIPLSIRCVQPPCLIRRPVRGRRCVRSYNTHVAVYDWVGSRSLTFSVLLLDACWISLELAFFIAVISRSRFSSCRRGQKGVVSDMNSTTENYAKGKQKEKENLITKDNRGHIKNLITKT